MSQAELNYLVLYCDDVAACRDFYTSLGLRFVREQHGESGPVHYAATLAGGVVLELYPAVAADGVRAAGRIRLGLTVPADGATTTVTDQGANVAGREIRLGARSGTDGLRVQVDPGATVRLADLPPYSIALDGVVQGPELDLDNHRISFDHHGACIRLVTAATCRQVADALLLGFDPATYTAYVNDVDGDTVLAAALLAHPEWLAPAAAEHDVVRRLVDAVGGRDAHGPAYPIAEPALLDAFIRAVPLPRRRSGTDAETAAAELAACVAAVARLVRWLAGTASESDADADAVVGPDDPAGAAPAGQSRPAAPSFVITHTGTWWVMVTSDADAFDMVYAAGHLRVVMWRGLADGSTLYTVARRSDLVDGFPVGPADRPGTILAALAAVEPGWGGGTSIGGAPRRPDGGRSRLTPDEVFAVVESVVTAAGAFRR